MTSKHARGLAAVHAAAGKTATTQTSQVLEASDDGWLDEHYARMARRYEGVYPSASGSQAQEAHGGGNWDAAIRYVNASRGR